MSLLPLRLHEQGIARIPIFQRLEEEAEFWDTHSAADYWHEMHPVDVTLARPASTGITVRFEQPTLDRIRQVASKTGMGATTLIRMWVLERLQGRHVA